jgi:CHAD domain-containing protein
VERLARALDDQVRRFSRAVSGARKGDVTAVHQARVASRRLRELLPVAIWVGPADLARRARIEVRRATQNLGGVRELDVTRGLLDDAAARHAWHPAVVGRLRRRLDADRRRQHAVLAVALGHDCIKHMLRDLRRIVRDMPAVPENARWEEKLDARRRQRARAFANRLHELGPLYVPLRLHAVRIAAKKLRYSLEADRAIRRAAVTRDIRALELIQEHLGHLHDLQILQERLHTGVREVGVDRAGRAQLQRMRAEIEGECRTLHSQVLARADRWLRLADRVGAR